MLIANSYENEPAVYVVAFSKYMSSTYYGVCFRCKQYGEVTFRSTKSVVINEETGEKEKGKRFVICLSCLR